jgi:predicted ATP-dependent endonuclease of OLD family
MELRKDVHEIRDQIDRAKARGEIREADALALYQRKVRDYVMGVETVLDPADDEASRFWTDVPIGDFVLPDDRHKYVTGLSEFLELPETYEIEIERERKRSYRHAAETVTETQRVRPPERLIERAFRTTNKALDAAGFDIKQPDETDTSGFERIDDVAAATDILDYLNNASADELRELQQMIARTLEQGSDTLLVDDVDPKTNGHSNGTYE